MLSWVINGWWHRFGFRLFWFSLNQHSAAQLSEVCCLWLPIAHRQQLKLDLNRCYYTRITYLNPCLSKSWTQLFLKLKKSYLVGNGSWSPISMLDLRPNKQTSKPGRRKVPNEVPSSIEYRIEEEETRQIEMEVDKRRKNSSNWKRKSKRNVGNY